jgi:uncharacterized protein
MSVTVHAMTVEIFVPMLRNLSAVLDLGVAYAEQKKFNDAVLFNSRLAPDMLPLSRQVQIACDMAKNSTARLAGIDPPRFEDNETDFAQLKQRIAKTIDYVSGFTPEQFAGAEERDIKIPARDRTLEFKGLQFLQRWALANFYFHVTTAYAILRHNGVDLGKRHFLGGN